MGNMHNASQIFDLMKLTLQNEMHEELTKRIMRDVLVEFEKQAQPVIEKHVKQLTLDFIEGYPQLSELVRDVSTNLTFTFNKD